MISGGSRFRKNRRLSDLRSEGLVLCACEIVLAYSRNCASGLRRGRSIGTESPAFQPNADHRTGSTSERDRSPRLIAGVCDPPERRCIRRQHAVAGRPRGRWNRGRYRRQHRRAELRFSTPSRVASNGCGNIHSDSLFHRDRTRRSCAGEFARLFNRGCHAGREYGVFSLHLRSRKSGQRRACRSGRRERKFTQLPTRIERAHIHRQ